MEAIMRARVSMIHKEYLIMRRSLKSILLASAVSGLFITGALAADLPDGISDQAPAPAVKATDYNWSGVYVGGNLGLGLESDFTTSGGFPLEADTGFIGGGVIGYNYQYNKFVFGAEADINYTSLDASNGPVDADLNLLGSVTARLGYTPIERLLVYGEGGYGFGRVELSAATGSETNFHSGYVVGGGAEYAVTDHILTGVEYNYTDLQSEDFNLGGTSPSADYNGHAVKFNVKNKF